MTGVRRIVPLTLGWIDLPPEEGAEQIRRLKAIASQRGYPLIPGHDPVAWPKLTEDLSRLG